jgi:hypothetical protein
VTNPASAALPDGCDRLLPYVHVPTRTFEHFQAAVGEGSIAICLVHDHLSGD